MDKHLGTNHAENVLKEIEQVKLSEHQAMLLNRFYDALREAQPDCRIGYATLERLAYTVKYEADLAIMIWQRLDDYLVKLRNDKLKSDNDKLRLSK